MPISEVSNMKFSSGYIISTVMIIFLLGSIVPSQALLVDMTDTDPDQRIQSYEEDYLGLFFTSGQPSAVPGNNDVNGDGFDDILLGLQLLHDRHGKALLIFGPVDQTTRTLDYGYPYTIPSYVDFIGDDEEDWFGSSVALGDLNNDGYSDVIVSSIFGDGVNDEVKWSGEVSLFLGSPELANVTQTIRSRNADVIWYGAGSEDNIGIGLVTGDLNADGIDDLIISAPMGDLNNNFEGRIYLVYGDSNIDATSVRQFDSDHKDYDVLFKDFPFLWGFPANNRNMAIGDITGDGVNDLIIGSPDASVAGIGWAGKVFIVPGDRIRDLSFESLENEKEVSFNDPSIIVLEGNGDGDYAGASLILGDANEDNVPDLFVGAKYGDGIGDGDYNIGEVYYIPGPIAKGTEPIRLNDDSPEVHTIIYGRDTDDRFGTSLAFNYTSGDLVVGAIAAGDYRTGAVHIIPAPMIVSSATLYANEATGMVMIIAENYYDELGINVATGFWGGDPNEMDVIAGAWYADGVENERRTSGDVYFFFDSLFSDEEVLNDDSSVDYLDLFKFAKRWGINYRKGLYGESDLNRDGIVDEKDLLKYMRYFTDYHK